VSFNWIPCPLTSHTLQARALPRLFYFYARSHVEPACMLGSPTYALRIRPCGPLNDIGHLERESETWRGWIRWIACTFYLGGPSVSDFFLFFFPPRSFSGKDGWTRHAEGSQRSCGSYSVLPFCRIWSPDNGEHLGFWLYAPFLFAHVILLRLSAVTAESDNNTRITRFPPPYWT
jgi:hypothetical protein